MKRAGLCVFLCAIFILEVAATRRTLLQAVNLNDRGMSTEGGEAQLYRVSGTGPARCRIEVVHFGETGKATYVFNFGSKLISAARTDYEYNTSIGTVDRVKIASKRTMTLRTSAGRKRLSEDFGDYRSFFDRDKLAEC